MKNILSIIRLITVLAVMTFMAACSSDDDANSNGSDMSLVHLSLRVQGNGAETRAISESNDRTISNLLIFIFDKDGNIVNFDKDGNRAPYQYAGSELGSPLTGNITVNIWTKKLKNTTVYAVANVTGVSAFTGIKTKAEFDQLRTTAISSATDINNEMFGYIKDYDTSTNGTIQLQRLCAKFNIDFVLANGVTLDDYQLCHVPNGCWYSSSDIADASSRPSASFFGTNIDFAKVTSNTTASANDTKVSREYYIYESLVGKGTNSNADGWTGRYGNNVAANASYLVIHAHSETWKSTFYVYLGGKVLPQDTPSDLSSYDYTDYSIYRNANYKVTVNISGGGKDEDGYRVIYQQQIIFGGFTIDNWTDNDNREISI